MIESVLQTQVYGVGPAAELDAQMAEVIAGRRRCIHLPHYQLDKATQALLPGTITVFCGPAGNSKSIFKMEILIGLHERGERIANLEMEHPREFHLTRALALMAGESRLTEMEWVKQNPAEAKGWAAACRDRIESFGRTIHTCPVMGWTQDQVAAWARKMAAGGCKVICIDPATRADYPDNCTYIPKADKKFINTLMEIADSFACAIFLVTHPKGDAKGDALNNIAGGAAYRNFCTTVMFMGFDPDPKEEVTLYANGGAFPSEKPVNRYIEVAKANNGGGKGRYFGFHFDSQTLRTKELGEIKKSKKGGWK